MKTRKLRLVSALLAVAMMLALLPTAAFAEDGNNKCGENLTWKLENNTLTISGTGAMDDYDARNNHLPPWYSRRDQIQEVVIGNGVTSIGNDSFNQCTNLKTIDLSNATSLEKIGSRAFLKRYYLEKVDLSKAANLKEIGEGAFASCSNVTQIEIPASVTNIEEYAFGGCEQLKSVTFAPGSKLETVDSGAFSGCDNLTIYYSDNNVETALSGKVGSVTTVKRVKVTFDFDNGTVANSQTVESGQKVTEPTDFTRDGWDFVGWYTKNADNEYELFDFDTIITENITLYARWTASGDCGAEGNENNVHWTLDSDGTMTISGSGAMADYSGPSEQPWANQRSSINKVVIGDKVTSIGKNAFANCPDLKVVELPQNGVLETIKYNAFSWLGSSSEDGAGITEITIPKSVKTIEKFAFDGCTKLATVTFAPVSELETIGSRAFRNTGISEISIPASVKKIGYSYDGVFEDESGEVFYGCSQLTKVIFESPSSLENVAWPTFASCSATIYGDDNVMNKLKGIVYPDKIKPLTPTVTFISNGGSNVEPATVKNGEKISAPDAPTREGYRFMGWYEKFGENEYKPFDFNTTIMDNITLYAQWEEVPVDTYIVTVENGVAWVEADAETKAVAAGESICVPEGATVHVKADETAFDGMAFERWEVRKGEVKLENDRAAETTFTMPAGEVQLEAMPRLESQDDSGWDAATVVTGAVIGTGTAILAYHIGMEVYAEQVLGKDVAVPRTRGEVALLAWQLAGSPEPNAAFELLTDEAKAQQWAVESGLMQLDAEGNFHAEKKLSKLKALRTLDAAKKLV